MLRLFTLLDNNGNGVIDRSDLEGFATRIGAADKAVALWGALSSLDADSDGVVAKHEFLAGADYDAVFEATVALHAALFDSADVDGDGRVSRAEWGAINSSLGISDADAESGFGTIDADRDGQVTRGEFLDQVSILIKGDSDLSTISLTRS
ncbi:EF-hand domain-containing protein [Umezawaea sp. NPDC059074]|uniref:EF-hand domain-containing protein n=1 Tax=Umezawaea sp. NPDC059074 TaxID=3346716 RepID=UPI0036B563BE